MPALRAFGLSESNFDQPIPWLCWTFSLSIFCHCLFRDIHCPNSQECLKTNRSKYYLTLYLVRELCSGAKCTALESWCLILNQISGTSLVHLSGMALFRISSLSWIEKVTIVQGSEHFLKSHPVKTEYRRWKRPGCLLVTWDLHEFSTVEQREGLWHTSDVA